MKKLVLLFVTLFVTCNYIWAEQFVVDDIRYNITKEGEVAVYLGPMNGGSVVIPSSVTYNGKKYSVTSIGDRSFNYSVVNLTGPTSVTIPSSVITIGNYAFNGCKELASVTMSYGVTTIGNNAFYGCTGLRQINIPSSVTTIGNCAFTCCEELTSVTIPSSVITIGQSAFQSCTRLTSITIPKSVINIETSAFYNCTGLRSITISNSSTKIDKWAFVGCTGLQSITIPEDLDIAEVRLYFIKNNIAYYVLNNHKVAVGPLNDGTGMSNYTGNIVIPSSITAGTTFTVSSIDAAAFLNSTVSSVTIPNSVTAIGESAFYKCEDLKSIICLSSTPPDAYSSTFTYCKGNLYVPCESKKKYESSTGWSSFSNIMCGATSVSELTNATAVTIVNGQILINGEAPAFVVTVSGQKIKNANLKTGMYFVVVDGNSVSVVVR